MVTLRIGLEEEPLSWEEWEDRVRSGRVPPDALVCFEPVTGTDFVLASSLEMYHSLKDDAAIAWRGQFLAGAPPVLTALLIGVQIRIWWFARIPEVSSELVYRFTNWTSPALEDGETWRLLTMGFLHIEYDHILFNMVWLAYTGWALERSLGRVNLAVLYLSAVFAGSILSMFASPESVSLGASGGVFGLVAATVVFGFSRPDLLPERGRRVFGFALLPYLVLMFLTGLTNETTDNWAHLGGLLSGIALALLLDPPGLERRPGWNLRMQSGLIGAMTLCLLALSLGGPWAVPLGNGPDMRSPRMPLTTSSISSAAPLPPYRSLDYLAPVGWRPATTASGTPGFASPSGARVWSVTEDEGTTARSAPELLEAWIAATTKRGREVERLDEYADQLAQRPAHTARLRVTDTNQTFTVEWRGTVRGVWRLVEVWQVEEATEARLRPLRDRLRASVTWEDPEDLANARASHDIRPDSTRTRRDLARATALAGEIDESRALWLELIETQQNAEEDWAGLMRLIELFPTAITERNTLRQRALERQPAPRVIVSIAAGLDAEGRTQEARGLRDLAWLKYPGERVLKRDRHAHELSTELDETGRPLALWRNVAAGTWRAPDQIAAWRALPLTVPAAAEVGRILHAERDHLLSAIHMQLAADPARALPLLSQLKHVAPVDDRADAIRGILVDLVSLETKVPRWIPESLEQALLDGLSTGTAEAMIALDDDTLLQRVDAP